MNKLFDADMSQDNIVFFRVSALLLFLAVRLNDMFHVAGQVSNCSTGDVLEMGGALRWLSKPFVYFSLKV